MNAKIGAKAGTGPVSGETGAIELTDLSSCRGFDVGDVVVIYLAGFQGADSTSVQIIPADPANFPFAATAEWVSTTQTLKLTVSQALSRVNSYDEMTKKDNKWTDHDALEYQYVRYVPTFWTDNSSLMYPPSGTKQYQSKWGVGLIKGSESASYGLPGGLNATGTIRPFDPESPLLQPEAAVAPNAKSCQMDGKLLCALRRPVGYVSSSPDSIDFCSDDCVDCFGDVVRYSASPNCFKPQGSQWRLGCGEAGLWQTCPRADLNECRAWTGAACGNSIYFPRLGGAARAAALDRSTIDSGWFGPYNFSAPSATKETSTVPQSEGWTQPGPLCDAFGPETDASLNTPHPHPKRRAVCLDVEGVSVTSSDYCRGCLGKTAYDRTNNTCITGPGDCRAGEPLCPLTGDCLTARSAGITAADVLALRVTPSDFPCATTCGVYSVFSPMEKACVKPTIAACSAHPTEFREYVYKVQKGSRDADGNPISPVLDSSSITSKKLTRLPIALWTPYNLTVPWVNGYVMDQNYEADYVAILLGRKYFCPSSNTCVLRCDDCKGFAQFNTTTDACHNPGPLELRDIFFELNYPESGRYSKAGARGYYPTYEGANADAALTPSLNIADQTWNERKVSSGGQSSWYSASTVNWFETNTQSTNTKNKDLSPYV